MGNSTAHVTFVSVLITPPSLMTTRFFPPWGVGDQGTSLPFSTQSAGGYGMSVAMISYSAPDCDDGPQRLHLRPHRPCYRSAMARDAEVFY